MKLYVYRYLDQITDNWHSGGGVVVATDRDPQAVLLEHLNKGRDEDEHLSPSFDDKAPEVFDVNLDSEHVWVFPDAGCC